jgi:hypothetical protein
MTETNKATQNKKIPEKKKRFTNQEFFSQDILGEIDKEPYDYPIVLTTKTAKSLYELIFECQDNYFYRPKEVAILNLGKNASRQIIDRIDARLAELDSYVEKRHAKVKSLYEAATAMDSYSPSKKSVNEIIAQISNKQSKVFLNILMKIDQTCSMANYLEIDGQIDALQEAQIKSELYRKTVEISRINVAFIGQTIIEMRKTMSENKSR